jgi:hypothetical protein
MSPATRLTLETVAAMPANTNPLAGFPLVDSTADSINPAADFVTRHPGVLQSGPDPFLYQQITVANSARLDFDPDLLFARLGHRPFD